MADQITWIEPRVRQFRISCQCGSIAVYECLDEIVLRNRFRCDRCGTKDLAIIQEIPCP